ncbi:penicillin-binding protein activator [Thalassotalea maritima]|uniref:penicillin-binding protein activator n=1 Tax=Thalassotalea maritima TaxID=3242416 RepID=UPI0035297FCD
MTIKTTYSNCRNFALISLLALLAVGCTSKPDTPTPQQPVEPESPITSPQPPIIEDGQQDADDLLELATDADNELAIVYMLQASKRYIDEQQLSKSLHLSNQLSRLPLTESQATYNKLNLAHALFELGEIDKAYQYIAQIDTSSRSRRLLRLRAEIIYQYGLSVDAVMAYSEYFSLYPSNDIEQLQQLYELIASLQPWQLDYLKRQNIPQLDGWIALDRALSISEGSGSQVRQLLTQWQYNYPTHLANGLVSNFFDIAARLEYPSVIQDVAILLPLSDREKSLGQTIQAGILAGNDEFTTLHFIDTNKYQMTDIISQLQQLSPQLVIGPLLKQHVDDYLRLMANQTHADSERSSPWQTLLLNLPENQSLQADQFAISMLPEAEARQAAFTLRRQGYENALVLSQDSSVGQRMAKTFSEEWLQQGGKKASVVYYPEGKGMQAAVKRSLDVNLSDERIKAIRNGVNTPVEVQPRNRRDIDMIYIIANTDQARLIKPYIDVNISPSAEVIPLFASSRSHDKNIDANSRRDLSGLTFTDAPWLLPEQAENLRLVNEARDIWPNRSSQAERLYALGIDSIKLSNLLQPMTLIPSMVFAGETGKLKMNRNRVINRSLLWATIRASRIVPIDME